MKKFGPLQRVQSANQMQGFRILDCREAVEKNKYSIVISRAKIKVVCSVQYLVHESLDQEEKPA